MNTLSTYLFTVLLLSSGTYLTTEATTELYNSSITEINKINDINYSQTVEAASIMFEAHYRRPPYDEDELVVTGYIKPKNKIEG